MRAGRDFSNALVVALISIGLIVGALSISLVEFVPNAEPTVVSNIPPSPVPLTATFIPTFSLESLTPSNTPTSTTTSPPPTNCPIPSGWGQIIIQASDTLASIAARYRITSDELSRANCLFSNTLVPGSIIHVPPVATSTYIACIPGAAGWSKNYVVKPGDNLYRIGIDHYTTLDLMRKVNCRTSDTIYSGEVLWVPNVAATRTQNPTALPGSTATPYPTDPLTETALPFTATFFPTNTPVPTVTLTPLGTP